MAGEFRAELAEPAEVAQRADNSVEVLLGRYAKCLYDIEGLLSAYDRPPDLDE
ncbi:hypothetical protein [Streptomyces sp. NPDC018693]|uniref:hypothetical protein n=1 Tax=unclassified Streptomyces TaxID=2593676 RepID=UPI0037B6A822